MLFLGLCITTVTADPTVDEITTEPAEPTPLSTVKVIATITGENIISVKLTVAECDDESCFLSHPPIEMNMNEDGKYETELTLEDDKNRANHIQYQFMINDFKALILTAGFIYFLHVFFTGRIIPFAEQFQMFQAFNIFGYFSIIWATTNLPISIKLKKEKLESQQIALYSASKQEELLDRAEKIRTQNEFLYEELYKQAKEEGDINKKELEFIHKVEATKSIKMEILKIIFTAGLSLI